MRDMEFPTRFLRWRLVELMFQRQWFEAPFAGTRFQKKPVVPNQLERLSENPFACILLLILMGAILRAFYVLTLGLGHPLLDMHAFRQTQTALSVYWFTHGGPWLRYETPVLGAPWSIPFEFPLFQWLVSLVVEVGVPIDAAGRIVAFSFYLATLWPLHVLIRAGCICTGAGPFLSRIMRFVLLRSHPCIFGCALARWTGTYRSHSGGGRQRCDSS